ncbi:Ig-like domain-containing protein [Mycolicibacterium neoaurum]|uniref:Ig-like domain-containing protein n=1 Tax=Mycolicibacterium neoaurum TaxID=1795 RepID=UPI003D6CDE7E
MTYSLGNGPSKGTVTVNADGTYTYTATTAGWNESDTFTIVGTINGQSITVAEVTVPPRARSRSMPMARTPIRRPRRAGTSPTRSPSWARSTASRSPSPKYRWCPSPTPPRRWIRSIW